jgi:hypothetical protein
MRTFIAILAMAALAGCTVKNTTVKQAEAPPPRVVTAPAPIVVYQNPAVAVPPPAVVAGPTTRTVTVSYAGAGGFQLAAQKAAAYCDQQFGNSNAELISDNAGVGRAVFACD